ncbi:MAG: DUF6443 domain-containing protein [Candidatus Azobacteroides sp.]|nr:DUF6443 domain-containing protein [Candidatus Azobacteroides sp.]
MKKTILYIILTLSGIVGMYSQPEITSNLGTIEGNYTFKMERTAANAANTYCIGFTINNSFSITIKETLSNPNFMIQGYFIGTSATLNDGLKLNTPFTLSAGQYRVFLVDPNPNNKAFKMEMTFTGQQSGGGSTGGTPTGLPLNVQANGGNYIKTAVPRTEKSSVAFNPDNSEIISIQYFDGLGRPVETVQNKFTPSQKDLVTLQDYDEYGRESFSWLPTSTTNTNGAFVGSIASLAQTANGGDAKPYSYLVYEYSPLNRIQQQYGPGADWQGNSKGVKTEYLANSGTSGALSCALFMTDGTGVNIKVKKNNFYPDAQLYVVKTTDEDGNIGYQFKDKLDQLVLTRQILGGANLDTYYVYDDFGNLCFVLPPMASEKLIATNGTAYDETNSTPLNQYGYQYKYDGRNRCIAKRLPGCEWIYYVYDTADHLIFTQDGENRKKSEWQFSIPDAFGRVVITGTCKNSLGYSADPLKTVVVKGAYNTSRTNLANSYTVSGVTLSSPVYLTANYYDDYAFTGITEVPNNADTQYNAESGYATRYTVNYKGMPTGTVTAQMNPDGTVSSSYLYSVMYYDYRNRLIQTKSNSQLAGGLEKEYIAYDFMNNPTGRKHIHSATGKTTQTEIYVYAYDHAERLTKATLQLNGGTTTAIAENTYDELGRLKTNKKGGLANLNTTYAYNIRSWIKSVTNPLFTETLYYNESYGGSAKLYNGNLSAMSWKLSGESMTRGYAFTYDNLSRLTVGNYLENGAANTNYKTAYSYDKMGNILTLQRYGKNTATTYGIIDYQDAAYNGNRLYSNDEMAYNISLAESADFKKYSPANPAHVYNANGALTKDMNKGISDIQYNLLNLPRLMDIKNPVAEARNEYTYSATGQKLKVVQKWNPNYATAPVVGSAINTSSLTSSKTTEYAGNMIYENGTLKRILIDGGYIEGGAYYYYLTDHQGNNRLVVNASGSAIQKNHYYPFGMAFAETPIAEQGKQPYKYNGKELDPMNGLNWYDYSARNYDPAYGRFTTMDPMCEKYYNISPYAYCNNNPVNAIDLQGDTITTVINTTITNSNGSTSVQSTSYYYGQNTSGSYGFIDNNGQTYSGDNTYVNNLTTALNDLRNGGNVGNELVSDLMNSTKTVQIGQGNNATDPNGAYIKWDSNNTQGGFNKLGTQDRPSFIGLGHEMAHIQDIWNGTIDNKTWISSSITGKDPILNAEKYATHVENQLRAENGITLREYYGVNNSNGVLKPLTSTKLINKDGSSIFYPNTYYYRTIKFSTYSFRYIWNY